LIQITRALVTNLRVSTHPEGLDIDRKRDRIFVNIADSAEVAVIDGTTHAVTATWKLTRAKDNVPLAYDPDHDVLFVACLTPGRLLVIDAASGKEIADLTASGGVDDLFYDSGLRRIYLIAGSVLWMFMRSTPTRPYGCWVRQPLKRSEDRTLSPVTPYAHRWCPGNNRKACGDSLLRNTDGPDKMILIESRFVKMTIGVVREN
jgi:hypothetical protein